MQACFHVRSEGSSGTPVDSDGLKRARGDSGSSMYLKALGVCGVEKETREYITSEGKK